MASQPTATFGMFIVNVNAHNSTTNIQSPKNVLSPERRGNNNAIKFKCDEENKRLKGKAKKKAKPSIVKVTSKNEDEALRIIIEKLKHLDRLESKITTDNEPVVKCDGNSSKVSRSDGEHANLADKDLIVDNSTSGPGSVIIDWNSCVSKTKPEDDIFVADVNCVLNSVNASLSNGFCNGTKTETTGQLRDPTMDSCRGKTSCDGKNMYRLKIALSSGYCPQEDIVHLAKAFFTKGCDDPVKNIINKVIVAYEFWSPEWRRLHFQCCLESRNNMSSNSSLKNVCVSLNGDNSLQGDALSGASLNQNQNTLDYELLPVNIPSNGRPYAMNKPSEELDALVKSLLSDLVRYQMRSNTEAPSKAKSTQRLLWGLKTVSKLLTGPLQYLEQLKKREIENVAVKSSRLPNGQLTQNTHQTSLQDVVRCRLKAVIFPANLRSSPFPDITSAIDSAVMAIVTNCKIFEVPVIFALSRNLLGKICCKSVRQNVVGIVNIDGAKTAFDMAVKLANESSICET